MVMRLPWLVLDNQERSTRVFKGWPAGFAYLTGVCPQEVLLVLRNPAFNEEIVGILRFLLALDPQS